MTVAELIALLQDMPQDALVVQSSDAEGNNFSPTAEAGLGRYAAETTWRGDFGLYELTPEDEAKGYTDEDVPDGPPAVCIWPTN
jgi:hypothetical protein